MLHAGTSLSDDFDVTTIYNFQNKPETEEKYDGAFIGGIALSDYFDEPGNTLGFKTSDEWKVMDTAQTMIRTPGDGYAEFVLGKTNNLKVLPLDSSWTKNGIVVQINSTVIDNLQVALYLSVGPDTNVSNIIKISVDCNHDTSNTLGIKMEKCIYYGDESNDFRSGARECYSLLNEVRTILFTTCHSTYNILITRPEYGPLEVKFLEINRKVKTEYENLRMLSDIKYIGVEQMTNETRIELWKPVKVFGLQESIGTLETYSMDSSMSVRRLCVLVEHYLDANSHASMSVEAVTLTGEKHLLGIARAPTNELGNSWKTHMFVDEAFHDNRNNYIFKITVKKTFSVTCVYKEHEGMY
ncbi:hypothetical protein L9F63_019663 [Diploptera punctata]|uniref:Uncharacterized protein n=1 Tax=Diploptera punctata TaxID=6984 RepID=A0AAD7ZU62_DIPPU|nr:hypothetical protein L9F63_019663 [Diploptera punctata]